MASYEELYQAGERFRKTQRRPEQAIDCYREALAIGGSRDVDLRHMTGVCYAMMGKPKLALDWYVKAIEHATEQQLGNICRDQAEVFSRRGRHDRACVLLVRSLELLPYLGYPDDHAATLGFLARTEARLGNHDRALRHFAVADAMLHVGANRELELYNKLHYATALAEAKHWASARRVAARSVPLARRHGSREHLGLALALMTIGAKAAAMVRRRHER